jgi:hypothetical protein
MAILESRFTCSLSFPVYHRPFAVTVSGTPMHDIDRTDRAILVSLESDDEARDQASLRN